MVCCCYVFVCSVDTPEWSEKRTQKKLLKKNSRFVQHEKCKESY